SINPSINHHIQIMSAIEEKTPQQKLFNFSCHCGDVKFLCNLDSDLGQSQRCNCSSCFATRLWEHPVTDPQSFKLLTPESNIGDYRHGSKQIGHYFCKTCGTQVYVRGEFPGFGPIFYVSITCIQGLTQEQFAAIPIHYVDGAEDNYMEPPIFTKHL
ncbi:hypothetical protein SAMD00019534_088770, partial [Acytostelium subglobosum LB1]|uniref:hypothetical protein n=1 Tax=Acytostelium subglobosum LB1 TaxID=1410327 RepID=UPI000644B890